MNGGSYSASDGCAVTAEQVCVHSLPPAARKGGGWMHLRPHVCGLCGGMRRSWLTHRSAFCHGTGGEPHAQTSMDIANAIAWVGTPNTPDLQVT